MKKIIIIVGIFLSIHIVKLESKPIYNYVYTSPDNITILSLQYDWMNEKLYNIIKKYSTKYDIDYRLVCAVIDTESKGRNITSRKENNDGTRDHGIMQINEKNIGYYFKTIDDFYNIDKNIKFGCKYLSDAYEKSGYYKSTIRLYNQGLNGKKHRYNNWKYVTKVIRKYYISISLYNWYHTKKFTGNEKVDNIPQSIINKTDIKYYIAIIKYNKDDFTIYIPEHEYMIRPL